MPPAEASSRVERVGAVPRSVSFATRLSPDRAAAAAARRVVRTRLGQLLDPVALDDVLLVVSELVTNAVRHGRGDVELLMACEGPRVSGSVRDDGDGFAARVGDHAPAQVGGHGLHLVDEVSDAWGVRAGSAQVWFEISQRQAAAAHR